MRRPKIPRNYYNLKQNKQLQSNKQNPKPTYLNNKQNQN